MIEKAFIEKDGRQVARVTFTLPSSTWADVICLVGDFNDWNQTAHPFSRARDGTWTLTMDFECNRVYQFRYLRDGHIWMNDNQADAYVYNSFGSDNCVLIADPTFKPHVDQKAE